MRALRMGFALVLLAAGAPTPAAAGEVLDRIFPRGVKLCYAMRDQGRIAMLRLTRPVRVSKFDGSESRYLRVVVNFREPARARFEGNFSCVEERGRLTCRSDACESGGFLLFPGEGRGVTLMHGPGEGRVLWTCSTGPEATITPEEQVRTLRLGRGRGSCL